jgi:alkaline phosphatase
MKKWILFLLWIPVSALAQDTPDFRIHSHNDYLQNVPFWKALASGASSIEADIFLVGDSLLVAHSFDEIVPLRTFERLYLDPLQGSTELGLVKQPGLQLLIDIKSEAYSTLNAVIKSIEKYPEIRENKALSFVISGNRPDPSE